MKKDKRVFGYLEMIFDVLYLVVAFGISTYLLTRAKTLPQTVAGVMGLVLAVGDSFHLLPRIASIYKGDSEQFRVSLGIGKLVTSMTLSIFYILLWHIGVLLFAPKGAGIYTVVMYLLATVRIGLCLLPQNGWTMEKPPVRWGVIRNIPFVLQGAMVVVLFFIYRNFHSGLWSMWLAVTLSFAFYIPVILWANKNPKIGMLMLPKTVMYVWILILCLRI